MSFVHFFKNWYNITNGICIVEAAYTPGSQLAPARQQYPVLQHCCTLCTVPVYKLLFNMYAVINQCCPNCCPAYCSFTAVTPTQVVPLVLYTV